MNKWTHRGDRFAAMERLEKHFLSEIFREKAGSPNELEARHEALKAEVASFGPFDALDVVHLFELLEYRAATEIGKFAALAQTTDPEAMLQHDIPKVIVHNAASLKDHHRKEAKADSAGAARAAKASAKDKEAFQAWAKGAIDLKTHSGSIQIDDVRGMNGFESSWGQNDTTLKRWLKEAIPGFEFKRGAKKK